jgi:hypothetical protein
LAVYVDNVRVEWRGRRWCHLVADTLPELHDFAKKLGLQKTWFQRNASYPHYDVTVEVRELALQMGATMGSRIQIITCAKRLKIELVEIDSLRNIEQLSLFEQ